jgi:hypothetical protein
VKVVDFQVCWEALIACIGSGRIVQMLGNMYYGHIHEPNIILEMVASYDLWI